MSYITIFIKGKKTMKNLLYNLFITVSVMLFTVVSSFSDQNINKAKLPIVYHEKYNVAPFGEKLASTLRSIHPLDEQKFKKIYNCLSNKYNLSASDFHTPDKVSDQELQLVHSQKYLDSLKSSLTISKGIDLEYLLALVPNQHLQTNILEPMKYAVKGTLLGAELARKYGWSINLGGGFHHATREKAEGGCFFADIPLAVKLLRKKENKDLCVLVIDLDAHHGNGPADYFKNDKNTFIFDMYNKNEYPWNRDHTAEHVDFNYPLNGGQLVSKIGPVNINWIDPFGLFEKPTNRAVNDAEYLTLLKKELPEKLNELAKQGKQPDLIIYNAGTDPFEKDPWGCLSVSRQGLIERDEFVWRHAQKNNIPILMLLSGGYSNESAEIICESISNIMENVLHLK